MESYNRQLLRTSNLYSRVLGDDMRIVKRQEELLSEAPKDFTLVEVVRQNWQISVKVDSAALLLQKISADHFNKVSYIEEMAKRTSAANAGGSSPKGIRFS